MQQVATTCFTTAVKLFIYKVWGGAVHLIECNRYYATILKIADKLCNFTILYIIQYSSYKYKARFRLEQSLMFYVSLR